MLTVASRAGLDAGGLACLGEVMGSYVYHLGPRGRRHGLGSLGREVEARIPAGAVDDAGQLAMSRMPTDAEPFPARGIFGVPVRSLAHRGAGPTAALFAIGALAGAGRSDHPIATPGIVLPLTYR